MENQYYDYCGEVVEYINSLSLPSAGCHDGFGVRKDIIKRIEEQIEFENLERSKFIPVLIERIKADVNIWARGIVDEDKLCAALTDMVGETKQQPEEKSIADLLPEVLRTDEAEGVFCRAIDAKMMGKTATGFRWNKTKSLLAYLMGHFLVNGTFPDEVYSNLFGVQRLGQSFYRLADNKHGDGKPRGYEDIDKLFEK